MSKTKNGTEFAGEVNLLVFNLLVNYLSHKMVSYNDIVLNLGCVNPLVP